MKFEVNIENIGKLKNASISVRPLTILAGPNNTGKSFFSKTLYSVFDAINTNPIHSFIKYNLTSLQKGLRIIQLVKYGTPYAVTRKMRKTASSLNNEEKTIALIYKHIGHILEKLLLNEKTERQDVPLDQINPSIIKNLEQIINSYSLIIPLFEKEKKKEPNLLSEKLIDGIKKDIENLKKLTKDAKFDIIFSEGFSKVLQENLTGNFQIPSLNKIKRDADNSASISISDIGNITINSDIKTNISLKGFAKLKNTSRVIYIESPFYWKQQKALLLSTRQIPHFSSERRRLLIPKFFEDLDFMLMEELSGDMAFPDIFESLTKIIGGKIITDETGSLQFKEYQGKTHTLPIMATGVVQLALIALLIEKKVLDKNSILFIDEPETNLHPAWQVEMIKILFELAKAGVNIVVATHSADIMKYLEVIPNSEKKNMIALNHLKVDSTTGHVSTFKPERSIEEKIKAIKKELTEPYTKLFIQGRQDDVRK